MARPTIIATNDTIRKILKHEIMKYGNAADLNHIDVSKVTNMVCVFNGAAFNGDISKWDVSNVTDMQGMFQHSRFNGDISHWNVSNVITMSGMFSNSQFQGDISKWDVSNVTNMERMFSCSDFNGDINQWNVSNVKKMARMFEDSSFNGNVSNWDVSNATSMYAMFSNSYFHGNLSNWSMHPDCDMKHMLTTAKELAVPPLLQVDSIAEYRETLEIMFGESVSTLRLDTINHGTVTIMPNHGVPLLLLPDIEPEAIHAELTQEDATKLQMLYQLTGSVYQSVKTWEQQRQHHIPTLQTSVDFALCN
jgi:surface protein